jgi:hypothetical protein
MSKILVILNSAFNVSNVNNIAVEVGDTRLKQYIDGFEKLFEFDFNKDGHDVTFVLTDNTIGSKEEIDNQILEVLPSNTVFDTKLDNDYGRINKGAGVLTSWRRNRGLISQHDFILHFEPRLFVNNFTFFDDFFYNPRTLITIGTNGSHFNTGLFSFKSDEFNSFINHFTPEIMVNRGISIEYLLYNYVNSNNLNFDTRDKMDLSYHDAGRNKTILV